MFLTFLTFLLLQNNMTWQSDEDFFEDISQLDDFRESIDPEMHSKQFIQYAEVRDERHEKQKKSFLEIDDDEDIPIVSYDTEPKSVLGISDDVGRQIEFVSTNGGIQKCIFN